MPSGAPGSPDVRAKMMSWVAWCRPELKRLAPLMTHSSPSRVRAWFRARWRRSRGSARSARTRAVRSPSKNPGIHWPALVVGAEVAHHEHVREVADDRALVLQVVVQPKPLAARCSRMIAISRLLASLSAVLLRERRSAASRRRRRARASRRGAPPIRGGDAAVLEVGAGVLASMVEEADVVSRSSGSISRSMNSSISASTPGRWSGKVKSTLVSSSGRESVPGAQKRTGKVVTDNGLRHRGGGDSGG